MLFVARYDCCFANLMLTLLPVNYEIYAGPLIKKAQCTLSTDVLSHLSLERAIINNDLI